MKYILLSVCICCIMGIGAVGCDVAGKVEDANQSAGKFFRAFDSGDIEKIKELCAPELLKEEGSTEHFEKLIKFHETLGAYISFEVLGWHVTNNIGSGTFITVKYDVSYSNYKAEETIIFVQNDDSEFLLVYRHDIATDAFLDNL